MPVIKGLILQAFQENKWKDWVFYTQITQAINTKLILNKIPPYRAATIERQVRKLAQEGLLKSDSRGNFMLNINRVRNQEVIICR